MSNHKLTWIVAALAASTAACATNTTEIAAPRPTGAPRMAKGALPMTAAIKPKTVTAVREVSGKPAVATRSTVTATGAFSFSLEVGIRYTFVITLENGEMIPLYATDAATDYYNWIAVGNSLDGATLLDFSTVVVVNNVFVSNTVLLGIDWDDDGIADFTDPDDDNDGIDDADDFDIDGDGLEDNYLDTDNDGECDLTDPDDDGDGIADEADADDDGDGIDDSDEVDAPVDIDGDGDDDGGGDDGTDPV